MVYKKGNEKEETILGGGRSFQSDGRTLRGKLNATQRQIDKANAPRNAMERNGNTHAKRIKSNQIKSKGKHTHTQGKSSKPKA